ncbi:hypothetical protein [Streptomyces chiangmaiensis]|uniref:Acyl-CoA dehydrogenase/oxidase C-terminal domain-containing protein n=1 Tax=Streptomyces chiangmaiensis TaxID=766497 RepID=A0ABU7FKX8_9ACTN|nr:hypothetical protein [Streptomyces chiangmaiensis]MED7824735.1 hypothetical protein [Streptomyces chiangmaiensis]
MYLVPTERRQRLRAELRTHVHDPMPDRPPPADDGAGRPTLLRRTFGGGASEVQREVVAAMRLGMRRGRR